MRLQRDDRGAVAILVAIVAVTLFITAALVIDLGLARDTRRQSQNASDASALAAANVLYPVSGTCDEPNDVSGTTTAPCWTDAAKAAKAYAEQNFGTTDWGKCATLTPPTDYFAYGTYPKCITFNANPATTGAKPDKVSVVMPPRNVKTGLGVLADVNEISVGSAAKARVDEGQSVKCGLCFLGPIATTKFNASVSPGGIAVNGSVKMSGNGSEWDATTIGYVVEFDPNNKITHTGDLVSIPLPGFEDPWKDDTRFPLAIPTGPIHPAGTNPCTAGPGVYTAWEFKNACTFAQGGLYVVTGAWTWKNVKVTADKGVTIYATGPNGYVDTKNGDLILVAPSSGPLAGLGIVYDRNNSRPLLLQGNGSGSITGAIYAPASNWDYNGGSDLSVVKGPIILKSMTGNGTTGVKVTNSVDAEVFKIPGAIGLEE
jgi:Flp pilus assembly protein TadG